MQQGRRANYGSATTIQATAVLVLALLLLQAVTPVRADSTRMNWALESFGTPWDGSIPFHAATNVGIQYGDAGASFAGSGHSWINVDLRGKTVDASLYRTVNLELSTDVPIEVEVMAWNSERQYVTSGRRSYGPDDASIAFDFGTDRNWSADIVAMRLNFYGQAPYRVQMTSFDILGGQQVVTRPAPYEAIDPAQQLVQIHFVDEQLVTTSDAIGLYVDGERYTISDTELTYDSESRVLSFDASSLPYGASDFQVVVDQVGGQDFEHRWTALIQPAEWVDERGYTMNGLRQSISLDGTWKISGLEVFNHKPKSDVGQTSRYWEPSLDDGAWESIQVPYMWYGRFTEVLPRTENYWYSKSEPPTYVVGWYRREFTVPDALRDQRLVLRFGAVGYQATVWLNGVELGTHKGKYTPFEFDITGIVDFEAPNVVAVRVEDDFGDYPATHTYGIMWYASYNIGGIWQSVDVVATPNVYIEDVRLRPELRVSAALRQVEPHEDRLRIGFNVVNTEERPIRARLSGLVESLDGTYKQLYELGELDVPALGTETIEQTITLGDVEYWTPETPTLYKVTLVLRDDNGEIIEVVSERTGFRDFRVVGSDFFLNGERIYLFGGNLFSAHFIPGLGSPDIESAKARLEERLRMWKESGTTILRTAHMPLPPWAYEMADEMGIMLMNEWGWFHRVFSDFPNQAAEDVFFANNTQEMTEWIARDFNHPSVVMWVINNEAFSTELMNVLTRTYRALRPLDDSGRPISTESGLHSIPWRERGPVDTDLYDQHNYVAWPLTIKAMDEYADRIRAIYGEVYKPLVVWEALDLDYSYAPPRRLPADQPLTVQQWLQHIGSGHTAKYSSLIGMKAYLDPELGPGFAVDRYGKRFIEAQLQHPDFKGLAPWIRTPMTEVFQTLYRPVVPMLSPLHQRHLIAGNKVQWDLRVSKKVDAPFSGTVEIQVFDPTGLTIWNTRRAIQVESGFLTSGMDLTWSVPAHLSSGIYRVHLSLEGVLGELPYSATNHYDITVSSHDDTKRNITTDRRVAVWVDRSPGASSFDVGSILDEWRVDYTIISNIDDLAKFDVLFIPPYRHEEPWIVAGGKSVDADVSTLAYGHASDADREPGFSEIYPELTQPPVETWVRQGGRLVVLPQELSGELPWLPTYSLQRNTGNSGFVDTVFTTHPLFEGMELEHWDMWLGHSSVVASYNVTPAGTDLVGATGGNHAAILEARLGQGSVLVSMADIKDRYQRDGAATRYVNNLFSYVLERDIDPQVEEYKRLFW